MIELRTTEQVSSLSKNKNGRSLKALLQDLLEETTVNGVTNKQLLAEKTLALALNGHEGMIKFVWANVNSKENKSSFSLEWVDTELDW